MKALIAAVLILSFVCLPVVCVAAGPDNAPVAAENADRGAGYLPYSDPAPMGGGGLFGAIVRTAFSLAVVLGLLYATLWLIRKVSGGTAGPIAENAAIRVVGRVYLSPKVAIYFIRLAGELLVVGVSPGAISLLTTLKDERQILEVEEGLKNAHAYASGLPFSRLLDKSLGRFQKTREGNQSVFDDQLRMLNDHLGRLRGLTRRRRDDDE